MLGISEHSYDAFCLDQACNTWGSFVKSTLESVDGKNEKQIRAKQDRLMHRLLGTKQAKQQFADPMDLINAKKS